MLNSPERGAELAATNGKGSIAASDNTINLGHLLTFAGFLITIMVSWTTLDKRVVVLEESRKAQAIMDSAQDLRSAEKFSEIRDTLGEIKRSVDKLNDKLERAK